MNLEDLKVEAIHLGRAKSILCTRVHKPGPPTDGQSFIRPTVDYRGWEVGFVDRGILFVEKTFATEDEACRYVVNRWVRWANLPAPRPQTPEEKAHSEIVMLKSRLESRQFMRSRGFDVDDGSSISLNDRDRELMAELGLSDDVWTPQQWEEYEVDRLKGKLERRMNERGLGRDVDSNPSFALTHDDVRRMTALGLEEQHWSAQRVEERAVTELTRRLDYRKYMRGRGISIEGDPLAVLTEDDQRRMRENGLSDTD